MPEKRKREMKVIDSMNPAFMKRRNNMDEFSFSGRVLE